MQAFENFYLDTDGIQDELVKTWAAVAQEFAADPTVAGYDLFNEPNWGADASTSGARLGAFTEKAITAIRSAETAGGGFSHIVFFEPVVLFPGDGTLVPPSSVTDANVVFAPHNYNDSIQGGTIEEGFDRRRPRPPPTYGTTFWIGEYGWFGTPAEDAAKVARLRRGRGPVPRRRHVVAVEAGLRRPALGRQARAARRPTSSSTSTAPAAPATSNKGPIAEWLPILSRAYPRSAPGTLVHAVERPGHRARCSIVGHRRRRIARRPARPLDPRPRPGRADDLGRPGLGAVDVHPVDGGYRVLVQVTGCYVVTSPGGDRPHDTSAPPDA